MKFRPLCLDCRVTLLALDKHGNPLSEGMRCPNCNTVYGQEQVDEQYEAAKARPVQPTVKKQLEMWSKRE